MTTEPTITDAKPSILVSFAYAREWVNFNHHDFWREVVLDSGAFTVHKSGGKPIDLMAFGEWVKSERARDPRVTECFTLDVIGGSWRESLKNTETLWKMGVDAIPVYHVGEPTDVLLSLSRDYPKIALGGAVGYSRKMEWAALCFKAVWPKKIHGLGFGHKTVTQLPFHTVDASNWFMAPAAMGQYMSMGRLPTKNTKRNWLRTEVDFQLRAERDARSMWRGRLPDDFGNAPMIRLAVNPNEKEIRSLSPTRLKPSDSLPVKGS